MRSLIGAMPGEYTGGEIAIRSVQAIRARSKVIEKTGLELPRKCLSWGGTA
jgi:hypothetical protein